MSKESGFNVETNEVEDENKLKRSIFIFLKDENFFVIKKY